MTRTIVIQTEDFRDVLYGDVIKVIRRKRSAYLGVRVEKDSKGRLFLSAKSVGFSKHERSQLYIEDIIQSSPMSDEDSIELESIVREIPEVREDYVPSRADKDFTKFGFRYKVGSRAALEDAVQSSEYIRDYFQNQVNAGDILLYQWMEDALLSSTEATVQLKKLIKALSEE